MLRSFFFLSVILSKFGIVHLQHLVWWVISLFIFTLHSFVCVTLLQKFLGSRDFDRLSSGLVIRDSGVCSSHHPGDYLCLSLGLEFMFPLSHVFFLLDLSSHVWCSKLPEKEYMRCCFDFVAICFL